MSTNQDKHQIPCIANPASPIELRLDPLNAADYVTTFAIPPDWEEITIDTERFQPYPRRAKGNTFFYDADSFIRYVNAHKTGNGKTSIWAIPDSTYHAEMEFFAIFNDHENAQNNDPGTPGWRDFTASYTLKTSAEFNRWKAMEKKAMTQPEFAEFLEDSRFDIAIPTGDEKLPSAADVYNLALQLDLRQNVNYKGIVRPQSEGIELTYTDGPDAETERKMPFFEQFDICIPLYDGEEKLILRVALKCKVQSGKALFAFRVVDFREKLKDAKAQVIDNIVEKVGLPVFTGDPMCP